MSSPTELLARWRIIGARRSEEVMELAPKMLKTRGLGDQEWAIREQLAIAALDLGRIQVAEEQLQFLVDKFRKSPRVQVLKGLRHEALGRYDDARKMYEALLTVDETDVTAHQRLIALSAQTTPQQTIPLLLKYLDTFYSDANAWSFLAELYADEGMYGQSMTALGHVMILQNWDVHAVRRAGETAYTMGDYQLALKHFLRAVEMETPPEGSSSESAAKTRSWWGVQMATKRLLESQGVSDTSVPAQMTTSPAQLRSLAELATEQILLAGGADLDVRRRVLGEAVTAR